MTAIRTRRGDSRVLGERALVWWKVHGDPERGDPGARARLRRCRSASQAAEERAAVDLAQRFEALRPDAPDDDRLVLVALDLARVLAHVKAHDGERRPMQAAGWKKFHAETRESDAGRDRPKLGEVRFRRLLATEPGEPLVRGFVRLVALLDGAVHVAELARDFVDWSGDDAERRERVRRRWAFDYFHASPAAPPDPAEPPPDATTSDTPNAEDAAR